MAWIRVAFRPGFAADLTSWEIEINRDGKLHQTVRKHSSAVKQSLTEHHRSDLSDRHIATLSELVAATDFEMCLRDGKFLTMDDAPQIHIEVDEQLAFSGALLTLPFFQRQNPSLMTSPLVQVLRLWQEIDQIAPYGTRGARHSA